jgi:hypothetical protein
MKQFDLYRLQAVPGGAPGGVEVVKQGFSWPGFLLAGIWALSKHLWLIGIVLIVMMVSLNLTSMYAAEEGPAWLWVLGTVAATGAAAYAGQRGNDWRRHRLETAGFRAAGVIEARNAREALAAAAAEDGEVARTLAASAAARRFSTGGVIVSAVLFVFSITSLVPRGDMPVLLSMFLTTLFPAVALLVRSFRPPVGFLRGLAVVIGGMFLGVSTRWIDLAGMTGGSGKLVSDLIFAAAGIALLWVGFRRMKPRVLERPDTGQA